MCWTINTGFTSYNTYMSAILLCREHRKLQSRLLLNSLQNQFLLIQVTGHVNHLCPYTSNHDYQKSQAAR